jgi:hypothetical protein
MNNIAKISIEEVMKKVEDGVSKKNVWQKPLLLLTKNGDDYNYVHDELNDRFRSAALNQVVNNDDVDYYEYLGGPLGYSEDFHHRCVEYFENKHKPVISFICVEDKNCSVENIPTWIYEQFEVVMLKGWQ